MHSSIDTQWHGLSTSDAEKLRVSLRAFIRTLTQDADQADDIFQETLIRTERSTRFVDLDSPLAYMITVAKSVLYDFQRKRVPQAIDIETVEIEAANDNPEHTYLCQEKLVFIEKIMAQMSPLRRQVFILRRVDGMTRDEIASSLGLSVEAVKKHLTRAMVDITLKLEEAGWTIK